MPRYYFQVHDGTDEQDRDGMELSGTDAARLQALRLAGEIIRDAGIRGSSRQDWDIVVTDHTGLVLFRMAFIVSESAAAMHRPARRLDHPRAVD